MKQITYILTFLILTSCGQSNPEQKISTVSDTTTDHNVKIQPDSKADDQTEDNHRKQSLSGFEKATLYKLTDTITADFNGDGIVDKAFYKKEKKLQELLSNTDSQTKNLELVLGKISRLGQILNVIG